MKKIAMLVLLMLFGLMNAASASVQNSEDDCGYYKTVYFSPIGTTNRTVSANLNMYHKTLEKEWSLGLGTQYYDTDEVYGYVNFFMFLNGKDDKTARFSKRQKIYVTLGNQSYALENNSVDMNNEEGYFWKGAKGSARFLQALLKELNKGTQSYIVFKVPVDGDKYLSFYLTQESKAEMQEALVEFLSNL